MAGQVGVGIQPVGDLSAGPSVTERLAGGTGWGGPCLTKMVNLMYNDYLRFRVLKQRKNLNEPPGRLTP